MDAADTFRWPALFQQALEPLFVLNRQRRLLFANRAWEALTGQSAADVRGLTCTRRSSEHDLAAIARTMSPPAQVMDGQSARTMRPVPGAVAGPPWWEIEFLPLTGESGLIGIIGKITTIAPTPETASRPLPEAWAALRTLAHEHFRLDAIDAGRQSTLAAQARLAANSRCPVYLVGETGAGKGWLARAIHHASDRNVLPFIPVDCAYLPVQALRGALSASVGTLYLKEPATLPRELQVEMAARLADNVQAGPRVIASTIEVEDAKRPVFLGQMLPDLYDALAVLVVRLPPLHARKDELSRLVDGMLKRAATAIGRSLSGLTTDAWDCVRAYHWPGNLRELYATLLVAGQRCGNDGIEAADLPLAIRQAKAAADAPGAKPAPQLPPLDTVLEEAERRMIRLALKQSGGNQSKAADLLKVWRPRLIRRIKALGIDADR